jgi:hypothetical protein
MFKLKIIKVAITLIALVALCSIDAASASASWFVGGTELKTSAAIATTAVVDEHTILLVPAVEDLSIECSGGTWHLDAGVIGSFTRFFIKVFHIDFLACNTIKPTTGCGLVLPNQTIDTLPIAGSLSLKGVTQDSVTLSPLTGKILAELEFKETNTCAFNGLEGVKGSVTVNAPTGQAEEVAQAIVGIGSVENNSLEVASSKAYLIGGKTLLTLASGSHWSFK